MTSTAVYYLCRMLAEMPARQALSVPPPMPVGSLTHDNFTVPDEIFFNGVLGLPPSSPTPYLLLCDSSLFPPCPAPAGSILLNRGVDGSMVRPHRTTAAPLSVRWDDYELEEEKEARRRERDARLAEEEEARRRERAAAEVSSSAVRPETAAVKGAPRRWESTRARLAREAREAEEAAAAAATGEKEEEGASSEVRPEATAA